MVNTLLVFLGAGIGGSFRHGMNIAVARLIPGLGFPLATLVINVLGSFLMGVLAEGFALRGAAGHPARLFLATGVLGGFTTFSSFSLDAITLYQRGETAMAAVYVLASVAMGLLGLVAGIGKLGLGTLGGAGGLSSLFSGFGGADLGGDGDLSDWG